MKAIVIFIPLGCICPSPSIKPERYSPNSLSEIGFLCLDRWIEIGLTFSPKEYTFLISLKYNIYKKISKINGKNI